MLHQLHVLYKIYIGVRPRNITIPTHEGQVRTGKDTNKGFIYVLLTKDIESINVC